MSIQVIVTFEAKPQSLEAFSEIMRTVKAALPTAPGCEGVRIFRGAEAPEVFTLVETWRDKEAHRAHVGALVEAGEWARIASHLACEPTSRYFDPLF